MGMLRCLASSSVWLPNRTSYILFVGLFVLAAAGAWRYAPQDQMLMGLALAALLIWAALIDFDRLILPNALTYTIIATGVLSAFVVETPSYIDRAAGAAMGYFVLVIIGACFKWRTGRDGIGRGDAKLLAGAGVWVGAMQLPSLLLIASLSAILFVCARRVVDADAFRKPAPFGPFIAAGFWMVWLWGPAFSKWLANLRVV